MTKNGTKEPRCSSGENCVAFPVLREPAKLSRSNPGPRCFACEERRAASEPRTAVANKKVTERRNSNKRPRAKNNKQAEQTEARRAREVLERRRSSVLTCERGLRSSLARGDERLVRRWSRSLREAEDRLAWAEADLLRAEKNG